jgi:signal transduction histidine kinase
VKETQIVELRAAYEARARDLQAALDSRERELGILAQVAQRVHALDEVRAILDAAIEEILDGLGLSTAWVFLGDDTDKTLRLAASRGVALPYLKEVQREGLSECLCPEVFWSGHRMLARNTTQCPRMPQIVEGLDAPVAHACIPLRFEGTTRGVLNVAARPGALFTDDQLRFLETVGHQVCLAIERASHREAERRRNQEARALAAISKAIGGSLDADAILAAVGETARDTLGADCVWIFLGSNPEWMRVAHVSGPATGSADDLTVGEIVDLRAMGWQLSVRALTERQVYRVDDGETDARVDSAATARLGLRSGIVAPFLAHDRPLGVMVVGRAAPHRWSDDQVDVAEALAAQASVAIENAWLYEGARQAYQAERLRNQEARALAAINKAIGGSLHVDTVLKAVGDTAREILGVERVQVLLGTDPRRLTVAHVSGLPHPELRADQVLDLVALDARLHLRALTERRAFTVNDWATDDRVNRELAQAWNMASGVCLPLLARDRVLGLITLVRTTIHQWTDDQVDVAEALAAQASVALENARLYEDLRRAYRELKDAQARIIQSEKMAVLGTFASGLAHEVRNPLNSIALQLSVLERRAGGLDAPVSAQVRELIEVIREEVKRLDSLVGDFLLFSRTSRVQHDPTDLATLVDEVLRLLGPEARAAGVELRFTRDPDPAPALRVDAERIKQVLINLVRNAIEAMPGGGAVVVAQALVDGRLGLTVRDTGPGLPAGIDVFQLFVTTKAKGTGLGLSIAQQIVLEHGGEITVASEPGKGAAFTVWLPLAPPSPTRERNVHE